MRLMLLSDEFYKTYSGCEEILQKPSRPYVCLEMRINNTIFAVPFRHHIPHKYAFFTCGEYGLDYTKAVVIADRGYISGAVPQIEQSEFNAIKGNEHRIHTGLSNYVKLYKKAMRFRSTRHYANILQCSSLQYFERFLK